jgi:uncharacterized protein (DUF2141 family)
MKKIIPIASIATLLSLTAAAIVASPANASRSGDLTVVVSGVNTQRGKVCLSLFNSSIGFPANASRAVKSQCVSPRTGVSTAVFTNLPAGSYAVAVIHDVNGDGRLNQNSLGIPTESFGFSRNPQILTGPPSFNDASFFMAGKTNIQVQLVRF